MANTGNPMFGMTYYVGGAGPIGNVGSLDVPGGLQDAGYHGAVEAFTWQGFTHAGDQINISRNRSKGVELAGKIRQYRRSYPNKKINIIALSAGTGIAAFALEYLPENVKVDHVVFLGCSMSARYDLTRALRRVEGNLYVVYSDRDPILKNVVWYTGTVDRASSGDGIAGMRGFRLPEDLGPDSERQYAKVRNVPWRIDFSSAGYDGGHIDTTSREFIRRYIGPILVGSDESLLGRGGRFADAPFGPAPQRAAPPRRRATSRPARPTRSAAVADEPPTDDPEDDVPERLRKPEPEEPADPPDEEAAGQDDDEA